MPNLCLSHTKNSRPISSVHVANAKCSEFVSCYFFFRPAKPKYESGSTHPGDFDYCILAQEGPANGCEGHSGTHLNLLMQNTSAGGDSR